MIDRRWRSLFALGSFLLAAATQAAAQSCEDHDCDRCSWLCRKEWQMPAVTWSEPSEEDSGTLKDPQKSLRLPGSELRWKGFVDPYQMQSSISAWSRDGANHRAGPDLSERSTRREVKFRVQHVDTCPACETTSGRIEGIADSQFRVKLSRHAHTDSSAETEAEQWVEVHLPRQQDGAADPAAPILDCRTQGGARLGPSGGVAWSRGGSIGLGFGTDPRGRPGGGTGIDLGGKTSTRHDLGVRSKVDIGYAPGVDGCEVVVEANQALCYLGCELTKHSVKVADPHYGSGGASVQTTAHSLTLILSCDDCGEESSRRSFVFDLQDRDQEDPCR